MTKQVGIRTIEEIGEHMKSFVVTKLWFLVTFLPKKKENWFLDVKSSLLAGPLQAHITSKQCPVTRLVVTYFLWVRILCSFLHTILMSIRPE